MSAAVKRALDIVGAAVALLLLSPLILTGMFLVWLEDRQNPFYSSYRIGRGGAAFRCYKLRSMRVGADRNAVDTTVRGDPRITPIGHVLRRYKLDELPQFWNVLKGDMSLVGPRPNVAREVALYTGEEQRMLALRPGITDFSSIVFGDLGDVLAGSTDPNLDYNQLVRPWKSRLILHYLDHQGVRVDSALMALTAIAIFSGRTARRGVTRLLEATGASAELIAVSRRTLPLKPTPPPGADAIVTSR